jgi:hypothetical protein
MSGGYSTDWRDEKAYNTLVRKSEGKRPLGRPRRKWEDNVRIDFRKLGLEGVDWMHLA